MSKNENRLNELQNILDEVLRDYGWTLKYDLTDADKIELYKKEFSRLFREKCCDNLILENSEENTIIQRVKNV